MQVTDVSVGSGEIDAGHEDYIIASADQRAAALSCGSPPGGVLVWQDDGLGHGRQVRRDGVAAENFIEF